VRDIAGDPEGFGMVAVEAAAHGLPTIAFATGGVVDAVGEGQSGHLIRPGDYNAFADAVLEVLTKYVPLRRHCAGFARQFAWSEFGAQMCALLRELVAACSARGVRGAFHDCAPR
jgi:phosphatidylinositol alpha-1,6-mannosyltransferase